MIVVVMATTMLMGTVTTMRSETQLMLLQLSGEEDEIIVMIAIKVMTKNRTRKRNRHCRMLRTAKAMLVFTVSFWQILHCLTIVQIRSLKQMNKAGKRILLSPPLWAS